MRMQGVLLVAANFARAVLRAHGGDVFDDAHILHARFRANFDRLATAQRANANQPSLVVDRRRGRRLVARGALVVLAARGDTPSIRTGAGLRSSVRNDRRRDAPCMRSALKNVWNQTRTLSTGLASRSWLASARVRAE